MIHVYFYESIFFKTNLFLWFHIFKLNTSKIIYDLYSQCLTQILFKTISFTNLEGVLNHEKILPSVFFTSHNAFTLLPLLYNLCLYELEQCVSTV
jgi:hypothetical protein